MNYLKMTSLAAVAAMALMAISAGSASATTLEVAGTVQSGAVTITASAESTITLSDTEGFAANTCSGGHAQGSTTTFSGTKVTGTFSEFGVANCTRSPVVVNSPGKLFVEWESGTTSGSMFSEGADVTVPTSFGFNITCTTQASGTKIGTLDGKASTSEHATLTISAVLSCGFLLPSAIWKGTYKITSPTGLGVVA